MLSLRRSVLRRTLKTLDLAALALACGAAAALSQPAPRAAAEGWLAGPVQPASLLVIAALLAVGHAALLAQRLYRPGRAPRPAAELWTAARAALLASGAVAAAALLLGAGRVSVQGAIAFPLVAAAGMAGARAALRLLVTHRRDPRRVLIVGSGSRAVELAQRLRCEPELGCRLLGLVDDPWPGLARARLIGMPVLGSFADLPHLLREQVVDDVVICLPLASRYHEAAAVVALCEEQGIAVRLDAELFPSSLARSSAAAEPGETPTVTLYPGAIHGAGAALKRTLDIALSLALLVLLAPVFLVVALLIKLDSPGPVFFLQQRRGLNKRPFQMIKFRTMRQDAERLLVTVAPMNEEFGPAFKIRNDPRVTRVGRYLRRTSIDELPQLINVLRGEMSLVGPRPLFHWEYDRIQEPWIKRRCSVKPGLTGLWQVSGRSDLPFDKRIALDLHYIDHWSIRLDIRILARTIPAVMSGKGAA